VLLGNQGYEDLLKDENKQPQQAARCSPDMP